MTFRTLNDLGIASYQELFSQSTQSMKELVLTKSRGKAKAGTYLFEECYCVMRDCDCRTVVLVVYNDKEQQTAMIDFSLDVDHPHLAPFLVEKVKQSAGAADFLKIFVETLHEEPSWYKGMCRRYKSFYKKLHGTPYDGEAFPKKVPSTLIPLMQS